MIETEDRLTELFEAFFDRFSEGDSGTAPVEWCERHVAEIPFSPVPGPFRLRAMPMIGEIIEAIVSAEYSRVSVVASVQSGKTLAAELAACFIVRNAPGPALWLACTDSDAKSESESRLQPLFEHCAPVKKLFPRDKNKKRNAAVFFSNGMPLWILGANNRRNLQSRSIRWLFGDEVWLWPQGRLAEAEARVAAFGSRGKCVFFSQGSFAGDDADRDFQASDRREWCFSCPKCGEVQPFAFENLHWDAAAKAASGVWDFRRVRESARLRCPHCGAEFDDSDPSRAALNARGKFVPLNPAAAADHAGFHWNALAVRSWGALAEKFLRAEQEAKKGRPESLTAFRQKELALPWSTESDFSADEFFESPAEIPAGYRLGETDWDEEGVACAEVRGFVPARLFPVQPPPREAARLRFMSVDVQDGYFVYVVRAWTPSGDQSRLLWNGVAQNFAELEAARDKFAVPRGFVFIDAGFQTQRVVAWCAENGAVAFQGDRAGHASFRHPDGKFRVYSPARIVRAGTRSAARVYYFSQLSCKDKLAELIRARSLCWQLPSDISKEYVRQMNAEVRTVERGKPMWIQRGKRANHFWDCETMQIAAACLMKVL